MRAISRNTSVEHIGIETKQEPFRFDKGALKDLEHGGSAVELLRGKGKGGRYVYEDV